jgi:hypothetical protein
LLALWYSLLFVAFSLILLFNVTRGFWVHLYIKFPNPSSHEHGKDTPEIT